MKIGKWVYDKELIWVERYIEGYTEVSEEEIYAYKNIQDGVKIKARIETGEDIETTAGFSFFDNYAIVYTPDNLNYESKDKIIIDGEEYFVDAKSLKKMPFGNSYTILKVS